jgi:tetratricopeptide (TPR) repeat protein
VIRLSPLLAAVAFAAPLAAPLAGQSIRIQERIEVLEARARQDSTDAAAIFNLAVGRMSQRRWDEADTLLERATSLDPQFAGAHFARSLVRYRHEDYWERLQSRGGDTAVRRELTRRVGFERRAFMVDPFLDVRLLGSVYRRGYLSLGASRAFEDIAVGSYADAFRRLEDVLRVVRGSQPLDSVPESLLWIHSLAAARAGQIEAAIRDVEVLLRLSLARERNDSLQLNPMKTNDWRYLLGALHQRQGNREAAARLYFEAAANDLGNYMVHAQLAKMYEDVGAWDHAIRSRQRAAEINHDDHTMFLDLGVTLARATRYAAAESALVRAEQMQPLDSRVPYRLGVVRQQLGKREEARRSFERFLALAPSRFSGPIADARQRLDQLR